jgi:hypothetical protein
MKGVEPYAQVNLAKRTLRDIYLNCARNFIVTQPIGRFAFLNYKEAVTFLRVMFVELRKLTRESVHVLRRFLPES